MSRLNPMERIRHPWRTLWQLKQRIKLGTPRYDMVCELIAAKKLLQRKWEIVAFLNHVQALRPVRVMEIGTYKGANLRCIAACSRDDTQFISLDLPGGGFGGGYSEEEAKKLRTLLLPTQSLDCFRMDSHAPEAWQQIQTHLGGNSLDLLFIDGDHSELGVEQDFLMYGPFVRPGGCIAFHDILPHRVHRDCQVHAFWDRLKELIQCKEIVDRDGYDHWGGIGYLTVPAKGVADVCDELKNLRGQKIAATVG